MAGSIVDVAQRVIGRTPEWVRQGLVAKDPATRTRAEDALAAMIAAALEEKP